MTMTIPLPPAARTGLTLLSAAILSIAPPASNSARAAPNAVGAAEQVTNVVTGELRGKKRVLEKASPVFRKEKVSADQNSSALLRLLDKTELNIGPGASLTLDRYVLESPTTARRITLKAAEGAFRFVSGSSAKSAYRIETPIAAIGVRGTVFDLFVVPDGPTGAVLQEGILRVCDRSGRCVVLDQPCQFARVDADGRLRRRARPNRLPFSGVPHDRAFPFDTACAGNSSNPLNGIFGTVGGDGGGDGDGGGGDGGGDGGGAGGAGGGGGGGAGGGGQ